MASTLAEPRDYCLSDVTARSGSVVAGYPVTYLVFAPKHGLEEATCYPPIPTHCPYLRFKSIIGLFLAITHPKPQLLRPLEHNGGDYMTRKATMPVSPSPAHWTLNNFSKRLSGVLFRNNPKKE